jgi:hypothetical protein
MTPIRFTLSSGLRPVGTAARTRQTRVSTRLHTNKLAIEVTAYVRAQATKLTVNRRTGGRVRPRADPHESAPAPRSFRRRSRAEYYYRLPLFPFSVRKHKTPKELQTPGERGELFPFPEHLDRVEHMPISAPPLTAGGWGGRRLAVGVNVEPLNDRPQGQRTQQWFLRGCMVVLGSLSAPRSRALPGHMRPHRRSTASLTYPRRHSTRAGRSTEAELRHEPYTSPRFCHTPSSPSQHSLLARLPDGWRSAYALPARLNGSVQLRGLRRISGMSRAR